MKNIVPLFLTTLVLLLLAATGHAGVKTQHPVVIQSTHFYGAIGSTRNSANNIEWLNYIDYGPTASIYARDASGVSVSCSTADPVHLAILRGVADSSYLRVVYEKGACTTVNQVSGSFLEPKQ